MPQIDANGIQWDAPTPAGVTWDDTPASTGPSQAQRFAKGFNAPWNSAAQFAEKLMPPGIRDAGVKANNWLADKTGLVGTLPDGGLDQKIRDQETAYQASRQAAGQTGMDWTQLAGNILNPANFAVAAKLPAAVGLGGRMASGALGGGLSSLFFQPVTGGDDYAAEKAKQVAMGAAFGGAMPALAAGIGRIISPAASTNPNLKLLADEGVKPTIGQTMGGRWNALEEKLTSLPIVGDAISSARGRALDQFNNAAINRASNKVGVQIEGKGQNAVAGAGNAISQAYDDALSTLKFVKFDSQFANDVNQLKGMAQSLTGDMRSKFNKTLQDVVGGRTSTGGTMLAETFKKVDSELGQQASRFGRSSVASEQELSDALKQLQALLRQQVSRSSPEASDAMKAADSGWANLVRVEGAAKAAKNNEGVFTPAQLNTAIQMADNSVRKRAVSRGSALMQDLGNAGQSVLGNKIPNSFTTDRALIAGGGLGAGLLNPAIPAGLLGGAALYTQPMQNLLTGAITNRPQSAEAIAELLKKGSPMLGPAGGLLGLGYMNQ